MAIDGIPASSISSSLSSLSSQSTQSITNGGKEQALGDIFGKITKAKESGRFVFVDKKGDVRTTGRLKTWLIRHFNPEFQTKQQGKLVSAFQRALGRASDDDYNNFDDRAVKLFNTDSAADDSEQTDGPSATTGKQIRGSFKLDIKSILNSLAELRPDIVTVRESAKESAIAAENRDVIDRLSDGVPGTHTLNVSKPALERAENSLNDFGHDAAVWLGGRDHLAPYIPANDAEIPDQFYRDGAVFTYRLDTASGQKDFKTDRKLQKNNDPKAVFEGFKALATKAGAKDEGQKSKAAQALSAISNQASLGIIDTQINASLFDKPGHKGNSIVLIRNNDIATELEFDITVSSDSEVQVEVTDKVEIKAFSELSALPVPGSTRKDIVDETLFEEQTNLRDVASFKLSTAALLKGETKIVPGSLKIHREFIVGADAISDGLEAFPSNASAAVDSVDGNNGIFEPPSSFLTRFVVPQSMPELALKTDASHNESTLPADGQTEKNKQRELLSQSSRSESIEMKSLNPNSLFNSMRAG